MTVDELIAREAIRSTLAKYNKAGDENDADGFASCFTQDALMEAVAFRHEGRKAIHSWKAASRVFSGGTGKAPPFRVHHIASIHIDMVSPDEARARTAWLVVTDIGPDHSGLYHDVFRREGEEWLIRHRIIDLLWRADDSCVGPELVGCQSGLIEL